MKATVMKPVEVEIRTVGIEVSVRYGDEDIPFDFPFRTGDMWRVKVDADTGRIHDWPQGKSADVHMKVCDSGSYYLYDENGEQLAALENDYVPHGVIPGSYGDYIEIKIGEDGVIANWKNRLDVSDFFPIEE